MDALQHKTDLHSTELYITKQNFLEKSKFKEFAEDKINMTQKLKFILG